jgi:protein-ribulosamine 3-kinase
VPTQFPTIQLARDPLRLPVEQAVSQHLRRLWTITEARDLTDLAHHPCAILSDGPYSVFAKFSAAANGLEQFEIELASLCLLSERSGVSTPAPIGIIPVRGGNLLILEAVQAVERTSHHWRQIGQTLACLHRVKGEYFGLETHGFFGPLYQDNGPTADWPTFFAERRLRPGLRLASDSGNLPAAGARRVEALIARLPEFCGPQVAPALLHGDAQQNNFISTEQGAVVIDPAVYYGHPEMDLAFVDFFQAVPEDVFVGYQAELPLAPGFWDRRELWRIWGYLALVTVGGPDYVSQLIAAVNRYI